MWVYLGTDVITVAASITDVYCDQAATSHGSTRLTVCIDCLTDPQVRLRGYNYYLHYSSFHVWEARLIATWSLGTNHPKPTGRIYRATAAKTPCPRPRPCSLIVVRTPSVRDEICEENGAP